MTNKATSNEQTPTSITTQSKNGKYLLLPLAGIKPRPNGNVRELDKTNVENLKGSILKRGFNSTILVDQNGLLLCGANRLEALTQLKAEGWDGTAEDGSRLSYDEIPCIQRRFDSAVDKLEALATEVSENVIRKQMSKEEVMAAIQRLIDQGFKHNDVRVGDDETSLNQALAKSLGLSKATASRRVKEYFNKFCHTGEDAKPKAVFAKGPITAGTLSAKQVDANPVSPLEVEANSPQSSDASPDATIDEMASPPQPLPSSQDVGAVNVKSSRPSEERKDPLTSQAMCLLAQIEKYEIEAVKARSRQFDRSIPDTSSLFQQVREKLKPLADGLAGPNFDWTERAFE